MNVSKFSLALALAVVILALFNGLTLDPVDAATINFDEFQITTDSGSQEKPDINGINIVWQDNRNGNWDIYMYTLEHTFTPETQITTNPANQIAPAISGDIIVYQDDRNGNWDIYAYNITAQSETQITNNTASQENPDIDGNSIVWQDNRNGTISQIYMYNLTSQTEKCLSTSTPSSSDRQVMWNTNPAISGNRVVYQRREVHTFEGNIQEDHREIICYDLTTGAQTEIFQGYTEAFEVIMSANDADSPAIYGSRIVFESNDPHWPSIYNFYREWNIHMHDTASGAWWDTTSNQANQQYPDINDNYIVYQDDRNGNWEIYLYNTDSGVESRVTNNTAIQEYPRVWGGRVVYMDNRNGNWDIYMTMISYAPEKISPPPNIDRSPAQALPPEGGQGEIEMENFPEVPEFSIPIVVAIIIAVVVSIALIACYKKHELVKNKQL